MILGKMGCREFMFLDTVIGSVAFFLLTFLMPPSQLEDHRHLVSIAVIATSSLFTLLVLWRERLRRKALWGNRLLAVGPQASATQPQGVALVVDDKSGHSSQLGTMLKNHTRAFMRARPRERGQAVLELAFALPFLMLLVLGAVDFGRVFFVSVQVGQAARQGVAYAAASTTNAADTTGIHNAALDGITGVASPLTVTATGPTNDTSGGRYAKVTVTTTFLTLFDWPGIPHSIPVTKSAQWKVIE